MLLSLLLLTQVMVIQCNFWSQNLISYTILKKGQDSSYLQRQDFFVDAKEEAHSLSPRSETSHVTTHFLGTVHTVIFSRQVGM